MEVIEYVTSRSEMVDVALRKFIHERIEDEMMEMVAYMATGGKRLRGVFTLLGCEAVGGAPEDALVAACAMELAHSASLAKDDFMDNDSTRRGRPAAWVKYGAKLAMLTPDVLLPHAMNFVTEYGLRALHSLNMAWGKLTFGQLLDYPSIGKLPLAAREYERIIGLKTAPLFEVACSLGVRASKKEWFLSLAQQYGYNVGMAFQIYDDGADLIEFMGRDWEEIGKGKGLATSMQALRVRVGGGGTVTEDAKNRTFELANVYLQAAQEAATAFPDSEVKSVLEALPAFACFALLNEVTQVAPTHEEVSVESRVLGIVL